MLEVKDLKKIYKTKNGAAVHALDGVTLQFPETGMVFLLGKSGSGKSTLLNVCGGLDSPTSGEVIVKGRSSKGFSQSDFDSYRNTFVGFIFQEYNILNEFTVEDNIAMALELQGKPKNKKAIAALLKEVDLDGYAKRKPNTLSGGQKQRIAIARALIKKPEIIMADEPTGALDSSTGKQVFDTLKKLSKTKLVIVVSHDRDFAEQYGDRIIELKDGLVISDVSKAQAGTKSVSENIKILGDLLYIKKGADLSDGEFEGIKRFLRHTDRDVIIATDEKAVSAFKTANHITDGGERETFVKTATEAMPKKHYTKEDSRFIRSKLPLRHAFKIGVSGMKGKPVRLAFTVLLCCVAFIMFGLLSTLNFYNSEATFRQTLRDATVSSVKLYKQYKTKDIWYNYGNLESSTDTWYETAFTPTEVENIANTMNTDAFGAIYCSANFTIAKPTGQYWNNYASYAAYLPEGNSLREKITGKYAENDGELVLSSYLADMLVACGTYNYEGDALELNSPEDIIGETINVDGNKFTVTGILDTGDIPAKFDSLKDGTQPDNSLKYELEGFLNSGLHYMIFVSENQIEIMAEEQHRYKGGRQDYMYIASGYPYDGEYQIPDYSQFLYNGISESSGKKLLFIGGENKALADDEIIVPFSDVSNYLYNVFYNLADEARVNENYALVEKYEKLSALIGQIYDGGIYEWPETGDKWDDKQEPTFTPFTDEEREAKLMELMNGAKEALGDITVGFKLFDQESYVPMGDTYVFKIVGVYIDGKDDYSYKQPSYYVSDAKADELWDKQKLTVSYYNEIETEYVESPDSVYSMIILPGNVPEEKIDAYWSVYSNKEFGQDHARISMSGDLISGLQMVDSFVEGTSKIFFYVGLVLAVFAALLLSNFISVSISNKKREIGILRAVGARSADVFKIFFSESFVIGSICVALSAVASYFLCSAINMEYADMIGASVFVFGIPSVAVLIGIAAVTMVVATFIPVQSAARKKPVDSIRSL